MLIYVYKDVHNIRLIGIYSFYI